MKHLNLIPIIFQFKADFSQFTLGLLTIIDERTGHASALFHLGLSEEAGFTMDLFFVQGILNKYC